MIIRDLMVNHIQETLDLDDIRGEVNIENRVVDMETKNMVAHQTKNMDELEIKSMDDRLIKNIEKNIKSYKAYKSLVFHQVFFVIFYFEMINQKNILIFLKKQKTKLIWEINS